MRWPPLPDAGQEPVGPRPGSEDVGDSGGWGSGPVRVSAAGLFVVSDYHATVDERRAGVKLTPDVQRGQGLA